MRLLALMTLLPLLIIVVIFLAIQIPLPAPLPDAGTTARSRLAIVVAVPCFVAYIAAIVVYVLGSFDQPGRLLDRALTRFGLTGRAGGVFGRRYQGELQGRQVSIVFQPASSPRSHLLNVYLTLSRSNQAAIGLSRPLLDCRNCPEIPFSEPGLHNLRVFAADETWIRAMLADASAKAALASLIQGDEWSGLNELYFQPGRLWLRAHPRLADGDSANWLPALILLARAAESAPGSLPH